MLPAETVLQSENLYFGKATIAGVSCTIGYVKKFRWAWMATQLNTFVFIGEKQDLITKEMLDSFSAGCLEYSLKNNTGWPRGWQSGVASLAVLCGDKISPEAEEWCQTTLRKHWSAFEMAVLYKPEQKQTIRYQKQPLWGRFYFSYLTRLINIVTERLGWEKTISN